MIETSDGSFVRGTSRKIVLKMSDSFKSFCSRTTKKDHWIFGLGVFLMILGIGLGTYFPYFYNQMLKDQLELTPSSSTFKLWRNTPLPLYLDVYLFNWTNADELRRNVSVPHLEEVGPFVFTEEHERVNIEWNDNYTVTYNQRRKWKFVPEESVDMSVEITNLNVILTTVSRFLRKYEKYEIIINTLLGFMEQLTVTKPAKNWLFEGIDDKMMELYQKLQDILKNDSLPNFPYNKFGWFYGRNMSSSYDGIFTIKTGVDKLTNLGIMEMWNHMNKTSYYRNECAMVNGTSGELFPPMYSYSDKLALFISDLCSSITLQRNGSTNVRGIVSQNFVGVESTLDNGDLYPENRCFCGETCAPTGTRNVTACRMGAPLYFSFPHFYLADKSYTSAVTGMMPNGSEHEFILRLDPLSGFPTSVRAQFQVNLLLEPISWIKMFSNVPRIYMPMMWFRERAEITPRLAKKVLMMRILPPLIVALFYSLAGLGLLIIVYRLIFIYVHRSQRADSKLLISRECEDEGEDEDHGDNEVEVSNDGAEQPN